MASTDMIKTVMNAVKIRFNSLTAKISKLEDGVKINTSNIENELPKKMDKTNPVATGSFSVNRMNGSIVGTNSFAEGYNTTASGLYSHSEGYWPTASGDYSHAEGTAKEASGASSHAEGTGTKASHIASHAEGHNTTASGDYSHAEGSGTTASKASSHAEGNKTTASADYSHAEGNNTKTLGLSSHAEGGGTKASGSSSHAEGTNTTASGNGSHAEGYNTKASNNYSHAEGIDTTASGLHSHAEGEGTISSGNSSHSEGYHTTAGSSYQHVQGKYNISDTNSKYAHIVGNGTSNTNLSNAHTIDWSGNAWFSGTVEGTALIMPSSTTNSTKKFKITVDDTGEPTFTDTSDSTNSWIPYSPPTVTSDDVGKLLRVSSTGEWAAESISNMEEFNQLAKDMAGKLTEPIDGLAVGKYFRVAALDENGHAVLEAVDAKTVGVQDVQVAGASVVTDGVANVPIANGFGVTGVVNLSPSGGVKWSNRINALSIDFASQNEIDERSSNNKPLITYYLDYAVKAAMCDGKGAAWTADEQAAARERIGCYNGFTVLMDEVIDEEAQNIYFVLPDNAAEFIAYFESYNTAVTYSGSPYLVFDNVGNVNPLSTIYSYFGGSLKVNDINIKGIQKCVIINDSDVCVEYAAVSLNEETTNQSQARSGRAGIAKRTSNKINFHITGQSFPIGMRFLVLVRCK